MIYPYSMFLCSCQNKTKNKQKQKGERDFPGGAVVKNLSANAGDMGSSPGLGRFHMPQSN